MTLLLKDDFGDRRGRGRVLGTAAAGQPLRQGRDVERILSIDGGALRIQPPLQEGWGRTCLSYGPFPARPGLTLAVFMLNGHNTSQSEVMSDSLRTRLERWAHGSGVVPVGRRLWNWLLSGRVRRVLRQARWWARIATGSSRVKPIDENLAVGFHAGRVADPDREGVGFVMHATGPDNGELRVHGEGRASPVARGVQNIPIHYVVRLRERDTLCLAAAAPGTGRLGAYPGLRPLAIAPLPAGDTVHASIHQCLLGQIGFRADTRVYGVRVAQDDAFAGRWAGAHAAASAEEGTLPPSIAGSVGGAWELSGSTWLLRPSQPSGLLRLRLGSGSDRGVPQALHWRAGADGSSWELALDTQRVVLRVCQEGALRELAAAELSPSASGGREIQVLDDGLEVSILVDGVPILGRPIRDAALCGQTGVGLTCGGLTRDNADPGAVELLEAFPRELPLPAELDSGAPWSGAGDTVVAADSLTGPAGDLAGQRTAIGDREWWRILGPGRLEREEGRGARWAATPSEPLPGRTIYALDWDQPGFADLSVTLTPPGTARGQREHGTAGFCLWQDADNYLLINTWLDDCYGGASLSSFFNLDGFEDLYDAVWTNVGERVTWGKPLRLRVVSDGLHYLVSIDGEPVLYRSLADVYPGRQPLRITRVGLLGNWEWGADTGSRFMDFEARAKLPREGA
ncbi:MAG: nucleotide-binding protein [bacterium]|nr:nucleotide-binding protein [bacterium]